MPYRVWQRDEGIERINVSRYVDMSGKAAIISESAFAFQSQQGRQKAGKHHTFDVLIEI